MARPVVGVVIPSHNGERYLGEAIESVLAQTYQALDLVVVDDGSTDDTRDVVRRYAPEVRYLTLPHQGMAAARNAGVEAARGDYLAFLDHDDRWTPQKLELQLAAFARSPTPELVFGHVREFVSPDLHPRRARRLRCTEDSRPATLAGTMVATRAAMGRVGPFATAWLGTDFMSWLLRARELGLREVMLEEHVLSRRLHDSNFSHRRNITHREYLRVLKESLDRRRASSHGSDAEP